MATGRPRRQKGSLQILKRKIGKVYNAFYYDASGRRVSKVLGLVSKMKKTTAEDELSKLVAPINNLSLDPTVREFVNGVYLPFCQLEWKESTNFTTPARIRTHIIAELGDKTITQLKRMPMQEWLKKKANTLNEHTGEYLSHSTLAHLRWDLKHILDLAVKDEIVRTNQAEDLVIPKGRKVVDKTTARPMDVLQAIGSLGLRERLIFALAAVVGLRPGEIFALQWGVILGNSALINKRVYRGKVDTVKNQIPRVAALPPTVVRDLQKWASGSLNHDPDAWVFPSRIKGRPGNMDSVWRRSMLPALKGVGLGWMHFQVLRRTWASTAKDAGVDAKVRADQLGHGVDVDINEYTQTDFSMKLAAVEAVERAFFAGGETVQ